MSSTQQNFGKKTHSKTESSPVESVHTLKMDSRPGSHNSSSYDWAGASFTKTPEPLKQKKITLRKILNDDYNSYSTITPVQGQSFGSRKSSTRNDHKIRNDPGLNIVRKQIEPRFTTKSQTKLNVIIGQKSEFDIESPYGNDV